jgi:hypothetical protein
VLQQQQQHLAIVIGISIIPIFNAVMQLLLLPRMMMIVVMR